MKKLNKKGFTLIEILSVITILAVIIAIAIPTVTYLIRKQRKNYYQSLDSSISLAGRDYFNSNRNERPTELLDNKGVTLKSLVDNDYITKVVDADGGETCSGFVYVIKNENKEYDYITCTQCKCDESNNNCEYTSENTYCSVAGGNNEYAIDDTGENSDYGSIWLYVNKVYKSSDLTTRVKITRTLGDKIYTIYDTPAAPTVYKDGVETTLDVNQPNIYQLKYSYMYTNNDEQVDLFANKEKRNLIIYQYEAPTVTYSSAINNAIAGGNYYNVPATDITVPIERLQPNGIDPDGINTYDGYPGVAVKDYLYSYRLKDTTEWSSWQTVNCGSQSGNERTNCTIDVESLSGSYEVRFAFNDDEENISLETGAASYLRITVTKNLPNCPTLTASGTYSNATGSNWYRSAVNISFSLPANISVTKSYINNSAGTDFVAYNQADINGSNYIDRKDSVIILRKAAGLSAGYVLGDYDGNGSISVIDARNALRVAVGLDELPNDEYLTRADTDGDGSITVTDARKILRCASGLDSCPTVQYSNSLGDVNNDGNITVDDARLVLRFEEIIDDASYIEVNNVVQNGNNYTISLNDNNAARTGKFIIKDNNSGLTNTCQLEDYQIDRTTPTVYIAESNGGNSSSSNPYSSKFAIDLVASTGTNISGQTFQWQKNGTNIAGETLNTITVNETGDYTVIVTTGAGLTATSDTFYFIKSNPSASCSNIQITRNNSKTIYNASDNSITYTIKNISASTINNIYYKVNSTITDIASLSSLATINGVVSKPSKDSTQTFEVGYKDGDDEVVCKNYTMKFDVTKPTCSVSVSGTAGTNGWYKGKNLTFKLNFSTAGETSVSYGLTTSENATYNSVSSKTITASTTGVKYYGYVKDAADNTNTCNSGAAAIKFENADGVSLTIDESTWNSLKSTTKKINNKYVYLFPNALSSPNPSPPWFNTSYGLRSSYWDVYAKNYVLTTVSSSQVKNLPVVNYFSRSCMYINDADWESTLKVSGASSGISSTSTAADCWSCGITDDSKQIKYNYNNCSARSNTQPRTVTGKTGETWPHRYCQNTDAAKRKWTITTNAGNSASVSVYVEFFAQCGY